jgi:hypothetical protein
MGRRALPLVLAAIALAGCGTPSADLFVVDRAGDGPGARLHLLVSDGGTVRCDGRPPAAISNDQLLDARNLQRDLEEPATQRLQLAPQPGSVLRYRVRTPDGIIAFADDSRGKPPVLNRLVLYVRELERGPCGRRG